MNLFRACFSGSPFSNRDHLSCVINTTDNTEKNTGNQRSNSEQLEVNAKLFSVIRKRKISVPKRVKKIKKLVGKKPQPNINAQDCNDNRNTALHLAIERNELELVNFLLSQGADTTIENGDGKTPLHLAEECNHIEIIDVLQSCTSQVERPPLEVDRLASHNSQPVVANPNQVSVFHSNSPAAVTGKQAVSTVLPPFSRELRVDKELKLSNDDFKQPIKLFHKEKQLSPIDQIKATPPYPTTHVLAQFASMAYRDFKHREPKTPEGWKLLTTAYHFGMKNDYFGVAYWHPEHQQVVIAHRGTVIKNIGALVTDVKGVLFNNYAHQMSSASTFANKVVAVLQEIEQEKKVSFELFFTGHSLGGWLAQITTFTTEYLEVKRDTFLKKLKREEHEPLSSSTVQDSHYVIHSYHPHTVVFDSPGCKDILSKMADKLDVRHKGSSIYLQQLDIASYLSAPNLINTCNKHLGTVYRIFTNLSDMGWKEKHTIFYNLATHSMEKIKHVFDPETGQVRKDDKGEPTVHEVVDWPVTNKEYNDFFKLAGHPNNYHPQVIGTVPKKSPQGYDPLRYQTKVYDECTVSLSVFTQGEQEFLGCYHWLRHVPEFFKPRELLSVMNNAEAEQEAERNLRDFKIGKKRIRCPDSSRLHFIIPYVKRLVRLFPHINEKVKEQLSSPQIRNKVYQHETQRYVEKIHQSALDFNPCPLGLREFLESDQQKLQLRMTDGDAWTGITKVYRVLKKTSCTPNYSSEGNYAILTLKRLLMVNQLINMNALLASMETPYLLMIACRKNQPLNDKQESIFEELFSILKQKNNIKIILTTQSDDNTNDFIQEIATETFGDGFITTEEQLTWSDLTISSQIKILEKTVIFQGTRVALNQLTSAEKMTNSFPLADLLRNKELTISEEPVLSAISGYNEKYYIDRTFNHNFVIRQDILSDKEKEQLDDLLANTEQEFKQLCQQNQKENVHWLEKDKSGELIWQQSQGNLKSLRKYIDAHKTHSSAHLENILDKAEHQRVILIADTAGMGKTTVLTHLSKRIKQKYPAHWLVRIDLNDFTELLTAQKFKKMDKQGVLEFVSKGVLKLESYFEKELFKKSFEGNEINKVVVMVDGFDEISRSHKKTVIDMIQILKQTSLAHLWVTTRPHLREELEDNLQQLSYTLQPFSEVEQVEFVKKFWLETNLELTNEGRLEVYATALIRKLAQSISDNDRKFTGIPLQTRMLAEAFEEECKSFYLSENSEPELPHKLELLGLYGRFIGRKYDICYEEKSTAQAGNAVIEGIRNHIFEQLQEKHQRLALEALFTEDQVTFLQSYNHSEFPDEELARIGIAHRNSEGKPQFIHRTFAEYFVADFLISHLTKKTEQHIKVQEFLLNEVLLRTDCQVIRALLNGLLETSEPSEQVLKDYGEKLDQQWNEREVQRTLMGVTSALHQTAAGDNVHIVGFLLNSLKSGEHSNTIKMMLLATDECGRTALHMAAGTNSVQALRKIWEWAEEVTPTLTNILLLLQDEDSKTAWQQAVEGGHTEVVEKLWNWATEAQINHGGLDNNLLLVQDSEGRMAWHVAALRGNAELIDKLWVWAKEELPRPDLLKNKFLLSRDKHGNNAWHLAAMTGSVQILGKLWELAKELQLDPEELRNELLLSKDQCGQTAWHMAAEGGHVELLEKLRDWTKEEKINPADLKSALFLSEHSSGLSAWHLAIFNGQILVLQKLWDWAEELQLTQNELNKLLLAEDKDGKTAIYWAACTGSIELLEKLWAVYKEMQLNKDYLSMLLVTAWPKAAAGGYIELLEWLWAVEVQINPQEFQKRLLLVQNKGGESAWHMAAAAGHVEVLEKLWGWAKENTDYLKSVLFLPEDSCGFSTWCYAIREARVDVIQKLWGWAEELQLTADELRNKLFLAVDRDGNSAIYWAACTGSRELLETMCGLSIFTNLNTDELSKLLFPAWHVAAAVGYLDILERLWLWAGEVQRNTHELKIRLLLEQNKNGECAWHMAAAGGHVEVLEKLWEWAKGVQINREMLKDKFFLDGHQDGSFTLQLAVKGTNIEISEYLLGLSEEAQIKANDLRGAMLLVHNKSRKTAWHLAVRDRRIRVLERMLDLAKEILINPGEVRNKLLLDLEENGRPAWFLAAKSSNEILLEELWVLAEEKGNPEKIKSTFLLAQNEYGQTALHVAAEGSVAVLEKLWNFAKEVQLTPDEVKYKLLLAKDKHGYTAWHRAAERGSLEALEKLWNWAKEAELNPDEMLLVRNEERKTVCHLAAERNYDEILQKVWILARETEFHSDEIKNKLLLIKDKSGKTAWHRAAKRGSLQALETLWRCAKDVQINPHELFPAKEKHANDSSQEASQKCKLGLIEEMLVGAKEMQIYKKELKKTFLLAKDLQGKTAWHEAAEKGHLQALELLWIWALEVELNPVELLLDQTGKGVTAFQMAAVNNHVEALKQLWVWAEEKQLNPNELTNNLLPDENNYGHISWHRAGEAGSLEALETSWSCAKEVEQNTDKFLLSQSEEGVTSFQLEAPNNRVETQKEMWGGAKEKELNTNELKNKLFLSTDKDGHIAWHRAAVNGSSLALETLWSWAKEVKLKQEELLLAQTVERYTAFQMAAENNHVETLKKLWVWAEQTLPTRNDLKEKWFLSKDQYGYIAWHRAAIGGHLEALETLWSWAKEVELTADELLLYQSDEGVTSFQLAAGNNHVETLKKLWDWTEETQLNPKDLKNKLLLAKDKYGYIAWHRAAIEGHLEALETIWISVKEAELNKDELLLAKSEVGSTSFHLAAGNNQVETLEKLWVLAEEAQLIPNELKIELFLAKDKYGYIAWHKAALEGHLEALQTLWSWAKEVELTPDELLLYQSDEGVTSFQLAAGNNHVETLKKLWVWTEETQLNPKDLKNKLLLAKDKYGYIAWHRAAIEGHLEALETIWISVKEAELNTEELLLAKSEIGSTSFHLAAGKNNVETLKKLWVLAEEAQLIPNELKIKLFLAKDKYGYIAWHRAATEGHLETLETLWSWAKEVELNPDELLLHQSEEGETSFQLAAGNNHVETLKKLWVLAEEAQLIPNELKIKLFLAKDKYGYIAWHRAATEGHLETLETLWSWAKEVELNPDELLLHQSEEGETSFQLAAGNNHVEALKKLWVWAEETQLYPNELKKKLLLAKDNDGYIAWHRAAEAGNLQALEILWIWPNEVELNTDEYLLTQTVEGCTAFQIAAENNHVEVTKKLWIWAEEKQLNPNELKNK